MKKVQLFLLIFLSICFFIPAYAQQDKETKIYNLEEVESEPEFTGGKDALTKFIQNNLNYPEGPLSEGIDGRVIVRFCIQADGNVSQPDVVAAVHPDLDKEAIRVVSQMPAWIPATVNGEKVSVWHAMPVIFRLKNKSEEVKQNPIPEKFHSIRGTSSYTGLEGLWQICHESDIKEGRAGVKTGNTFRYFGADSTFYILQMKPVGAPAVISLYGTYKQVSEKMFVETIESEMLNPPIFNGKNEVSFEIKDNTFLLIVYKIPGSQLATQELWVRVLQ